MIYVIIVTYNATPWLTKCIVSLLKSSLPLRIIAVDNGSTDGTQQIIKEKYPEVVLLQSAENLGFGKANNIGIKQAYEAGANYVFLLNQDAWVEKDTIESLINIADKNPEYGIISPIHLNGKGDALDLRFSHCIAPNMCPKLVSDLLLNQTKDEIYETNFVNVAAWLMSRKCIETVGGFNPIFHMYGEDDNYIHRTHYHGLKVGIYPFAIIYHDRENRPEIITKNTYKKNLKKSLLVKYSNPNLQNAISDELKWTRKGIIKSIIKIDMKRFKDEQTRLNIIKEIKANLELNTKISKQKGINFLEHLPNY